MPWLKKTNTAETQEASENTMESIGSTDFTESTAQTNNAPKALKTNLVPKIDFEDAALLTQAISTSANILNAEGRRQIEANPTIASTATTAGEANATGTFPQVSEAFAACAQTEGSTPTEVDKAANATAETAANTTEASRAVAADRKVSSAEAVADPNATSTASTAASKTNEAPASKQEATRRYTFRECVDGTAPQPTNAIDKNAFQLLMLGGMVTIMCSFNGLRHSGLEFFLTSLWMYPVILCIALCVRLSLVNRVVDYLAPRLVFPHFTGFARNTAMSLLNTALMSPIMGCFVTLLLNGPTNFLANILETLSLSAPFSFAVSLLVVGPTVRYFYHNIMVPASSIGMVNNIQRNVTGLAGIITG